MPQYPGQQFTPDPCEPASGVASTKPLLVMKLEETALPGGDMLQNVQVASGWMIGCLLVTVR